MTHSPAVYRLITLTLSLCLSMGLTSPTAWAQQSAPQESPQTPPQRFIQIKPLTAAEQAQYNLKDQPLFQKKPIPTDINAKSWTVVDLNTYQILAFKNDKERIAPGTMTQLMTAYVVFNEIKAGRMAVDKPFYISTTTPFPPSAPVLHLDPKQPVTVNALLDGMAVINAFDAAQSLAVITAGSESKFVDMMNREAQRLGLTSTHFANATGLPADQQYTTVSDMAWLASALIEDFPEQYKRYASKEVTYRKVPQPNRNRLLWLDSNVDGVTVSNSGNAGNKGSDTSLIASATHGPRRILAVVGKSASDKDRSQDAQKLLNFGFQSFDAVKMFHAGQTVHTLDVWKGAENHVNVGFTQDFILSVPRDTAGAFKLQFAGKTPLVAPITKGQTVGALKLMLDGQVYAVYPVVALQDVPVANWFGRTWDTLRWWIKK